MPTPPPEPPSRPIDAALIAAYRDTDYTVDAPDGPIVLRVDLASAPLADLMRALRFDTASLLTAYNPWSLPTASAVNEAARHALEDELAARGVPTLPAQGRGRSGGWPPEPGVLAFGLTREAADALALRYGQNAYVWVASPGAGCELAITRAVGEGTAGGASTGR